jgi:cobyrinic acid a,c-diamide synthase
MAEGAVATPRLVVAGVSSGVGKTTVSVALARALRARGLRPALFKCGPDYLDPTYHARATGTASQNLDGWMMGRDAVLSTFAHAAAGADVAIIEGMMGLFDGASATSDAGSTAEIAKWLAAPVALVVDAGAMARSIAAVALGFTSFDPDLRVGALVANRVGGRAHLELLKSAQRSPPILAAFPGDAEHAFPERHLGLRTADETTLPDALLDHWGNLASEWFALDALIELARSAPPIAAPPGPALAASPATCRIGIARDAAFHFYYADNLRRLESLGAELVPFSPIADRALPPVDGLYVGGGYPEVMAGALASNLAMREAVKAFADRGGPIYAECGGLMYLSRAIVAVDGARHPMVGVIPAEACMRPSLRSLGYVEVVVTEQSILGEAGTRFRGHQFRYSELSPPPEPSSVDRIYSVRGRRAREDEREGYRVKNVLASYVHAHWASNPKVPREFVRSCQAFRSIRAESGEPGAS